jgi:hypothetical protein
VPVGGGSRCAITSPAFGTSFCTGVTSAGFGSCGISCCATAGGSSDSIWALSVSSGRGAVVITGVLCSDSGGGGADKSGDMDAIVAGVRPAEGVTKLSFKVSVSSAEEIRRLERVGEDSGFTETAVLWRFEVGDCESPDEDDGRRSTPFSSTAGVRGRDRFRFGRGGGVSEDGCGEAVRS